MTPKPPTFGECVLQAMSFEQPEYTGNFWADLRGSLMRGVVYLMGAAMFMGYFGAVLWVSGTDLSWMVNIDVLELFK